MLYKVLLNIESGDKILSETIQMKAIEEVLFCGVVYYVVQSVSNF